MQVRWSDGSLIRREFPVTSATEDLDLVELVAEAARAGNHCAPPSPWLPALPSSIAWSPEHPRSAWAVLDDPAQQRQEPAAVDLATLPHTAIAGSVGSGRTTTALSLALAALAGHPDAHLYAVADPTGPLTALRDLPHTGAVIDRADPAALAWFADRLAARLREPRAAYLLVVIDGWDVLADVCDRLDHGALTDRLLATIREGYALGLRAVITGDRSVLTGRVSRTFPARYLHRPADDTDLVLAGLRASAGPAQWLPGRLLDAADGMEHQVLVRAVRDVELDPPSRPPWRIATLPPRVEHHDAASPSRRSDPDRPWGRRRSGCDRGDPATAVARAGQPRVRAHECAGDGGIPGRCRRPDSLRRRRAARGPGSTHPTPPRREQRELDR